MQALVTCSFMQDYQGPHSLLTELMYIVECPDQTASLQKHAYSNIILKILPPKKENFQIKNSDIFHISAQNIDCLRGSSNEYPQSLFLSRNKKNNVYPCKSQFYNRKVGFQGVKII